MPSESLDQHNLFGFWKSHPDARPASLSAGQVSEWLHADKGRHFSKANDGHVAKAMHVARHGAAFGGGQFDMPNPPWYARQEERGENYGGGYGHYGLIATGVPGRTDRHALDVPAGSYVLPADVVSGVGEGNTMAGAAVIDRMLHSAPYGITPPRAGGRSRLPRPPGVYHMSGPPMAEGGSAPSEGTAKGQVPIIVAGGEFIVPPDYVAYHPKLGALDPNDKSEKGYQKALTRGHDILDAWVKHARDQHIKTLKRLPGPAKD